MTEKIIDFEERKTFYIKVRLLPNYKRVLELSDPELFYEVYQKVQDCLIEGFKWDETEEGHEYWQSVYDSVEVVPKKICCNKKMRTSDLSKYYRCKICKKVIKTT